MIEKDKPTYVNCWNCRHSQKEFDKLLCWGFGRYMSKEEAEKGCKEFK